MIQIKDFRVFIIDFLIHYVFFICASFLFTVWSAALLPSSVFEMKIIYSDIIALNFSLMIILFAITSRFFSKFRKHFELSAVLISLGVILFFPNFLGGVFFSQLIYVVVILFLTAKWFNLQLDFISWLTESNLATQHRKKWLAFRKFVKNQSEIDKKDVSHYLLWGPFYYYCLATKGIEHKKISFFRQEKGFIFWSIITVLFVYIVSIVFRILFGYV